MPANASRHVDSTKYICQLCFEPEIASFGKPLTVKESNFTAQPLCQRNMKVTIKHWHAVAQWKWDTGNDGEDLDGEGDVCGICRVPYEGCCPSCKVPGDDCPLIWGECSHVFHMHCLLKWIGTTASKQQCPMDRRTWVTAERKIGASNALS